MTPTERVLSLLKDAKQNGQGWAARCPAHDDRIPSLSIAEGDDGRALVCCHAGCTVEAVAQALGLKMADLMPENTPLRSLPRKTPAKPPAPAPAVFPTAAEAVAQLESRHGPAAARWTYHNAAGEPVGLVLRWNLAAGEKDIRPVARTGRGWIVGGMPEPRPLYRLSELLARPLERVYIAEGEKAADAAVSIGLLATTSPHGAKSASKADWRPLAGRDVVILPDNDKAGREYAAAVTDILLKLTPPAIVRGLDIPGLPEGGDIWDWVEDHDSVESEALVGQVEALVNAAEPVEREVPELLTYKPFPIDTLPEPIRGFVTRSSRAMGCDPAFVAMPLLAALAAAVGNSRRILLKKGWSEPCILWTILVGESGTLKTPAFKLALEPVYRAQGDELRVYRKAMEDHVTALLQYEKDLLAWKRDKSADTPPEKPQTPEATRVIVSDSTVEALASILSANPRGVLLARDELAGWISSFDRYANGGGGADEAHWLSMHNGGSLVVDRKTGLQRTIYVPVASVSITGGIQPGVLSRVIGVEHRESGLLARLLLAMPPRKRKRWTEIDINEDMLGQVAEVFSALRSVESSVDGLGEPTAVVLRLTTEGKEAWVTFYNEHAGELVELTGDLAACWSKLEGYAARLALLIHLIRWACNDPGLHDPEQVDEESIKGGVTLARWFGHEARRVYTVLAESKEAKAQRQVVEWIEQRGGSCTVRDLAHGPRQYRGKTDAAREALDWLEKAGVGRWVYSTPSPGGGRPSPRFELVTGGTGTKTPADAIGNGGFGTGASGATGAEGGRG